MNLHKWSPKRGNLFIDFTYNRISLIFGGNLSMKKWNWGIFGAGRIARAFCDGLLELGNANLYLAASKSQERAVKLAEEYNMEKAYGSYEEALEDDELEICYISNLNTEHYELAKACMKAGKHLLIEKPITLNSEELEELIKISKDSNCFMMEAMWTKLLPITQEFKSWIEEGKIGEVNSINNSFGFHISLDPENRVVDLKKGGGSMLDLGVYCLTYADMFFDEEPVSSHYTASTTEDNVDISGVYSMVFPNHKVFSMSISVARQLPNNVLIIGEDGYIAIDGISRPFAAKLYKGLNVTYNPEDIIASTELAHEINGYKYEAAHVMDCLEKGLLESPIHSLSDSKRIMRAMDKARKDINLVYPQEQK